MKRILFVLMTTLPYLLMAQSFSNFPDDVIIKVEKTQVNTSQSDFGPELVDDELFFSAFTSEEIAKINSGDDQDVFYHLYAVPVDTDGNIRGGKTVKLTDISAGYHAGPVSYCKATKELFVTLSNYQNPQVEKTVFQKARIPLQIIILKPSGNGWISAGELPFNSSDYSVGHPAISVTGDTLIFASDIPQKGKGGTDLYMAIRENGQWGDMINLGDRINTSGNEMFPYLHQGKLLFFASNGISGGKGGLDIFYAPMTASGPEAPENLEILNSSVDDFGLTIHPNNKVGYFVSQKPGGEGDDDIYKVTFEPEGEFDIELLVRNQKSREALAGAKVVFSDQQTLYAGADGMVKRKLEKNSDYSATASLEGFMENSTSFSTRNKTFGTLKEVIDITKLVVGEKFVMENIYYDFDKWDILPESEVELNKLVKLMKENPSLTVELSSHTDSRGTDAYNETLSQKRAESAVYYIVGQGVPQSRITAKGYGESQLVNHCANGVECTDEEHRMNRRTEFTILGID